MKKPIIYYVVNKQSNCIENLSARLQSVFFHLTAIIWTPFTLFLKLLPQGSLACAVKPLEGCLGLPNVSLLTIASVLLWTLPFLSPILIFIVRKIKKKSNSFVYIHSAEAFWFQMKTACSILTFHCVLLLLSVFSISFQSSISLLLIIDIFFLPIIAGLQLLIAIFAAFKALQGRYFYYKDYCEFW